MLKFILNMKSKWTRFYPFHLIQARTYLPNSPTHLPQAPTHLTKPPTHLLSSNPSLLSMNPSPSSPIWMSKLAHLHIISIMIMPKNCELPHWEYKISLINRFRNHNLPHLRAVTVEISLIWACALMVAPCCWKSWWQPL